MSVLGLWWGRVSFGRGAEVSGIERHRNSYINTHELDMGQHTPSPGSSVRLASICGVMVTCRYRLLSKSSGRLQESKRAEVSPLAPGDLAAFGDGDSCKISSIVIFGLNVGQASKYLSDESEAKGRVWLSEKSGHRWPKPRHLLRFVGQSISLGG
jgi:hypothetical protein